MESALSADEFGLFICKIRSEAMAETRETVSSLGDADLDAGCEVDAVTEVRELLTIAIDAIDINESREAEESRDDVVVENS